MAVVFPAPFGKKAENLSRLEAQRQGVERSLPTELFGDFRKRQASSHVRGGAKQKRSGPGRHPDPLYFGVCRR